jgi:hypothetical protein
MGAGGVCEKQIQGLHDQQVHECTSYANAMLKVYVRAWALPETFHKNFENLSGFFVQAFTSLTE